jgi:hypothetical protein
VLHDCRVVGQLEKLGYQFIRSGARFDDRVLDSIDLSGDAGAMSASEARVELGPHIGPSVRESATAFADFVAVKLVNNWLTN